MLTSFEPEWLDLLTIRKAFYCRNLRGLIGYARHQAAKYGIKGSRLDVAKQVLEVLEAYPYETKMADAWDGWPQTDYSGFTTDSKGVKVYQVCGKMLQGTATVGHYIGTLRTFVEKYGHRAEEAKQNKGIDWKAISHAFRAAYQLRALFRDGTYTYPLPEAETLLDVKLGKWDYLTEASPRLDALIDEVESLSAAPSLPDDPDYAAVRSYLVSVCAAELTTFPKRST